MSLFDLFFSYSFIIYANLGISWARYAEFHVWLSLHVFVHSFSSVGAS